MLLLSFFLILLTLFNPIAWLATLWRWYRQKTLKKNPQLITLGNITFGGTGKTPMVIWISRKIKLNGIISKSYKASSAQPQQVDMQQSLASEVGDEPLLLAQQLNPLPVFSGPHKTKTLSFAVTRLANPPGRWLVDDGFQHFMGRANCNIILWDATDIWAFGMWPWGRGREPIWAIRNADAVVITKSQWLSDRQIKALIGLLKFFLKKPDRVFRSTYSEIWPKLDLSTPIIGIAGLARNDLFFRSLKKKYSEQVVCCIGFSDHCNYHAKELSQITLALKKWPQAVILTTSKDLIKLQMTALQPRLRLVDIQINIDNSDDFIKILSS